MQSPRRDLLQKKRQITNEVAAILSAARIVKQRYGRESASYFRIEKSNRNELPVEPNNFRFLRIYGGVLVNRLFGNYYGIASNDIGLLLAGY